MYDEEYPDIPLHSVVFSNTPLSLLLTGKGVKPRIVARRLVNGTSS